MRQVILVFAVLAVLAIAAIVFTDIDSTRVGRSRPLVGVVHGRTGAVYQVKDDDYGLAVSFPKGWNEQSQGNFGNTRNYNATATFGGGRDSLSAIVQRNSYSPSVVTINGVNYDLSQGSVFRIRLVKPGDDSGGGKPADPVPPTTTVEVLQFPFAPLEVTPTYVDQLDKYFKDRESR